ncbi:5'-methylthioadenosine/S-adenosylhomocysteine nucleosidase [Spiroplasma sp. AdecLV25b]|uniref:5'-methylthioadenosine/S-adenosylhomocysteine nucleosidase family protein n=1 Tax=Spiroplasma sp. AdecLV25b TaxID=3027162 RepID=UPI0027DF3548|nr:5'-methylthioadenosine/S-adenosylhomocysteine nucleosidase [Spiroplasma sp. AdecLV25b]
MYMILIIGAIFEEFSSIIEKLALTPNNRYPYLTIYEYNNVVIAISNVGLTNSTIAITTLLKDYPITTVYNISSATSLKLKILPLVVTIVQKATYICVNNQNLGYLPGQIPGEQVNFTSNYDLMTNVSQLIDCDNFVNIGSGGTIICQKVQYDYIRTNFNSTIDIVDMECTALFHTSSKFNVPIVAIKVISDQVKVVKYNRSTTPSQLVRNLPEVRTKIAEICLKIIKYHYPS